MARVMLRRSFLKALLAALFAPWLARLVRATGVVKAAPIRQASQTDKQELFSALTTYVYDPGIPFLPLQDRSGDVVTTCVYDSRVIS